MQEWFDKNIRYFKWAEFGPRPEKNDRALIMAMDRLREIANTPINVHCSWEDGGHSSKSMHYVGKACDFHFIRHTDYLQQYVWISKIPEFQGIGFYPQWNNVGWHVDLRDTPLRWVLRNGAYSYIDKDFANVIKNAK